MKKTNIILIKSLFCIFLTISVIFGIEVSANEIENYNIQTIIGNEFLWVSKPGNNSEVFKVGQEVKIPIQYLDMSGKKEINFIFYDKNNQPLDMTRYKVYSNQSGIVGTSTTSTEYKRKGHLHLPILGAGKTSIYFEDTTRVEASVHVAVLNILDNQTITSASGLPMSYNTPYYIFNNSLKGTRGGLTFEPYSNVDRLIYSNSVTGRGTSMIFQKSSDSSVKTEIKWGDQLKVKSSSGNWGNSTFWSVGATYPNVSFITLTSSSSNFYISNGRNVGNAKDTDSFGLSAISADMIITGDFLFYLNSLNPIPDNNKEWLKASGRYLFATNWGPGEIDKLINGLQASQQDTIKAYEINYKNDFDRMITTNDKIIYTISKRYHNAKIRYLLSVNGQYNSESYNGISYYSQSKENTDGNIEITTNANLKKGDVITLDVVTNEPGYPTDKSTILQRLASTEY